MASSVIEKLGNEEEFEGQLNTICYFFFSYNDTENLTIQSAYRSALAQILHTSRDDAAILDRFLFARYDFKLASVSGQRIASATELSDLMRICSHELGHIYLVLDGIDESANPDLVSSQLKALVTNARVKLICFSRSNVNCLQNQVPLDQRVGFDRRTTWPDIRRFLMHHLEALLNENMLPPSIDINHLAAILVNGADGMFLWARLMVNYLNSPALTPSSRLKIINSVRLPEGLSGMYDRIVMLITKSRTPESDLARRILLWISYSISDGEGLTPEAMQTAVGFEDDPGGLERFTSTAITVCGGLLEFTPQKKFQLIHLTVGEYFTDQPWFRLGLPTPFVPSRQLAAVELTSRCLEYILIHTPAHSPGKFGSAGIHGLRSDYTATFESYAALNWVNHLSQTDPGQLPLADAKFMAAKSAINLLNSISTFLARPLSLGFWIWCLYRSHGDRKPILKSIENWCHLVKNLRSKRLNTEQIRHIASNLSHLAEELRAVDKEWSSKLEDNPSLIWDDVLVFNTSEHLSTIAEVSGISSATTLVPDAPKNWQGDSVQCLCSISSSAANGMILGVLSVYPSQEFERFWKSSKNPVTAYHEAEQFCSSWTAKYELWSPDHQRRLSSLTIRLPENEILLVIRQSFRQDTFEHRRSPSDESPPDKSPPDESPPDESSSEDDCPDEEFDISFPLAISHDCQTFAILRTVYDIQTESSSSPKKWHSFLLPLEFFDHFKAKWTPSLGTYNPNEHRISHKAFCLAWREWYTYSIAFSLDGKYLAFSDCRRPCITHIAVFEVLKEPHFSSRLVRWTLLKLASPRVKVMIFHPSLNLLAFLSEKRVWIWDFSGGKHFFQWIRR